MSRPMRFVCAAGLMLGAVLIIREAPAEIQRTFGHTNAIGYLLAFMVGLFITIGGAFVFLRSALRRDDSEE